MTGAAVRLLAAEGETTGRDLPARALGDRGRARSSLLCVLLAVTLTFGKDR